MTISADAGDSMISLAEVRKGGRTNQLAFASYLD